MIIDQGGRAREATRYLAPPPALRPWVVEAWIQRYDDRSAAGPTRWRIVPDHQPHLLVHGGEGGDPDALRLVGPRSIWVDRPTRCRGWTAGVTLQPGALPGILGAKASALRDRSVGMHEMGAGGWSSLGDRVVSASTPEIVVALLFGCLAAEVVEGGSPVDWRVRGFRALAFRPGSRRRVADMAGELGVSPRTLRETWGREVGLSPREARSIERIHRAVRLHLARPEGGWAGVARAAGYFDQPHLIRDFRRLVGESPDRFLARGRCV